VKDAKLLSSVSASAVAIREMLQRREVLLVIASQSAKSSQARQRMMDQLLGKKLEI
jgi:hypothetical protein